MSQFFALGVEQRGRWRIKALGRAADFLRRAYMSPDRFFVEHLGAGRVARLAPFFVLGPISGPLTAGVVLNLRDRRPVLASLYALTLSLWLTLGPLEVARAFGSSMARL
jgi:hypothetical protein